MCLIESAIFAWIFWYFCALEWVIMNWNINIATTTARRVSKMPDVIALLLDGTEKIILSRYLRNLIFRSHTRSIMWCKSSLSSSSLFKSDIFLSKKKYVKTFKWLKRVQFKSFHLIFSFFVCASLFLWIILNYLYD